MLKDIQYLQFILDPEFILKINRKQLKEAAKCIYK